MTTDPDDQLPPEVLAALRAPAAVDPGVVDVHIDSALSQFDAIGYGPTAAEDPATVNEGAKVVPLRRHRAARWVAAAAAVVLAAGGVWLASTNRSSAPVQTADRAASAPKSLATTTGPGSADKASGLESTAESGAGSPSTAPSSAPTTTMAPQPATANGVDGAELANPTPQQSLRSRSATNGQETAGAVTCRAPRLPAALVSIAVTTVNGQQRITYTYTWGPGGRNETTVVLDPSTCART